MNDFEHWIENMTKQGSIKIPAEKHNEISELGGKNKRYKF